MWDGYADDAASVAIPIPIPIPIGTCTIATATTRIVEECENEKRKCLDEDNDDSSKNR